MSYMRMIVHSQVIQDFLDRKVCKCTYTCEKETSSVWYICFDGDLGPFAGDGGFPGLPGKTGQKGCYGYFHCKQDFAMFTVG